MINQNKWSLDIRKTCLTMFRITGNGKKLSRVSPCELMRLIFFSCF
jgi:hypothetical protein